MNSKYNFSLPASQSAIMVSLKSTLSKIPLKMQKWVKWSAENSTYYYGLFFFENDAMNCI